MLTVSPDAGVLAAFDRPIFLLSPPRSGSTLLFETLCKALDTFSIGGESHMLIETVPGLHPAERGWTSNRLTAADLSPSIAAELSRRFHSNLRDRNNHAAPTSCPVRMIEKTPKNSLRIPFLAALFPDAMFVFLYRDWRQTLSSMIEAWSSGRFITYPRLPEWQLPPWSLLLVPGWKSLRGRPLAEIVAIQWSATINMLLDDLEALPSSIITALDYDALIATPETTMDMLCTAVDLAWDVELGALLPLSRTTLSEPSPEKWRRHENEILALESLLTETEARAQAFLRRHAIG